MTHPTSGADAAREQVLAALRADIDSRIRPLMSHLPTESVDALIDRMARLQYRYEGAEAVNRIRRGDDA